MKKIPRLEGRLNKKVTGFLMRSEVVAGWPDLHFAVNDNLSLLRKERLSSNVLLYLFDGEVTKIETKLKPEALHFGLTENGSGYIKERKNQASLAVRLNDKRKINIADLAQNLQTTTSAETTSAQFAEQMI